MTGDFDAVLVGGGLANGLLARALRERRPGVRLAIVESGPALAGNHTWSFHESDVDERGAALLAPLVERRHAAVEVRFPDAARTLETGYASIGSAGFAAAVGEALRAPGSRLFLGVRAAHVGAREVILADGTALRAPLVVDARGPQRHGHFEATGFQKFLGLELELADGPALPMRPLIMDATVPQRDGYRFMYVLPLPGRRVLVEDTYYADAPTLDEASLRTGIEEYVRSRGWRVTRTLREERGVLPIPWGQEVAPPLGMPLRLGYLGGWFHPTTGYSLPLAVRTALLVAERGPEGAAGGLQVLWRQLGPQRRFCQMLNRWLFRAAVPEQRWGIFSRFYRLPREVIERFYALETTVADRARLVCGRPPRGVSLRSILFPSQAV